MDWNIKKQQILNDLRDHLAQVEHIIYLADKTIYINSPETLSQLIENLKQDLEEIRRSLE